MKRKDKSKPYKPVLSNVLWCFGRIHCYAPGVLALRALEMLVLVGLSYGAIYLPSLVVAEATSGHTFAQAARSVGWVMLAMLIGNLLEKTLFHVILWRLGYYDFEMGNEITRKSLSTFYQRYETKEMRDLMNRALRAIQSWNGMKPIDDLPGYAWEMARNVLCYLLFGTVISLVSPWLTVFLTVSPLINWVCVRAYQNWKHDRREQETDIISRLRYLAKKPGEYAMGKDIRVYGMSGWLREMYQGVRDEMAGFNRQAGWRRFLSASAEFAVILLRDSLAYALLIGMMLRGEITIDQFVLYFAAVASFADWVGRIVNGFNKLHANSLQIGDLRQYLDTEEQDGSGEAQVDALRLSPEIRFEHVSFRYDDAQEDTISDLCLTIRPGEKIAVVGLNGAGKTTLVKLLCGLYLPTQGDILVDGHSIRQFRRGDYYRLFSPVFQDVRTTFFTLAETVACCAEEQADLARAEQCMRKAGLGEKLDALPKGIHTGLDKQVNKDGTELSGGEMQKLMLARALYKNAPVLVLDEPTAALDPIAEHQVYRRYNEMAANKSSLFISHRLASTRFCDRILYLEKGRIAEEGSHDELIARGGEYARLYDMQSCWYRDGKGEEA